MAEKLNINDLVEIVEEKSGKQISAADARVHLRKLAKDGEIEKGEGRWSFAGKTDPAIKAVVALVKSGATARKGKDLPESDEEEEEAPAKKQKAPAKKARAKKQPAKKNDTIEEEDDLEVDIEDI